MGWCVVYSVRSRVYGVGCMEWCMVYGVWLWFIAPAVPVRYISIICKRRSIYTVGFYSFIG